MLQTYLTKSLAASSSNFLGTFSSATTTLYTTGATASVATASGAAATALDTQRRIIVWSSALDMSGLLVTLTGANDAGQAVTETIAASTAAGTTRQTTQDFLTITSVSFSSANPINAPIHIGTSTQGGTGWKVVDAIADSAFNFNLSLTFSSTISTTLANLELTLDDVTQTIKSPPRVLSTASSVVVPFTPANFIATTVGATALSTANASQTVPAVGNITAAFAAWRLTLTSSSSTAGSLQATGLQTGV
jgi:hypothetical protein